MAKALKSRASKQDYISPQQLILPGFESPFSNQLLSTNRWVILTNSIPWDALVSTYNRQLGNKFTGAGNINTRVAIGALIIKHLCNISDRETILQIQENMYMQYFIGYSSFSNEVPFDSSLFVDIRKRLTLEHINEINEKILGLMNKIDSDKTDSDRVESNDANKEEGSAGVELPMEKSNPAESVTANIHDTGKDTKPTHEGSLLMDATACPQDIAYPTDLNLLNDAREKSEELIDALQGGLTTTRPRTYREIARKKYLRTAQKKKKTRREIRKAIREQIQYLKRNISSICKLLEQYNRIPLRKKEYKYLLVIQTLYDQQKYMYDNRVHIVEDRIVSIHQPHVRPIVRGKTNANVEFGAKIQVSLLNGFAFLDELSWDAFNEGTCLKKSVEKYKVRFGFYPKEVLADKIYCTRENRKWLKENNIKLRAKPLGRPSSTGALSIPVRPGERNPIEGKFGQAKTAYGMNRIKARLRETSESWVASIVLVLNLINIIGRASLCVILKILRLLKLHYRLMLKSKIEIALT
ncbi:MAG: IS5 family transposase [Ginsengibacter sp.]